MRIEPISPRVSVLLCTRNRPVKLRRAIEHILGSSYGDFELIVVDQSTDQESKRAVETIRDERLVHIPTTTVGLSRARNIAIRAARNDIVVFTDDDCVCDPGWLSSIAAEYQRDPSVMGVLGRVVAYGEQTSGMFCPSLIEDRQRRLVDAPATPLQTFGAGANMSFRKSVFHQVGLFIESLGAGTPMKSGEDVELVYRALRRRMKFVYSPDALVYHDNWLSLTQYETLARGYIMGEAALLTKFALRLDRIAVVELARAAYHILRNKKGAGSIPPALGHFLFGCARGVGYCLASPPKLAANAL